MTASASVKAPWSSLNWIAAVASADYSTRAGLPIGVVVPIGGSVVVVKNAVSMTIDTAGTYYVSPSSLGAVVGAVIVLF